MDFWSSVLEMFNNGDAFLAHLIAGYGFWVYAVLFLIYLFETGIVFFSFLPAGSLIFVTGAAAGIGLLNPWLAFLVIALGTFIGNTIAYFIGCWLGNKVYNGSIRWIDTKAMLKTEMFFDRHGGKTLILSRFVPIVASCAPLVAGAARMRFPLFQLSGGTGILLWVISYLLFGYFFGNS